MENDDTIQPLPIDEEDQPSNRNDEETQHGEVDDVTIPPSDRARRPSLRGERRPTNSGPTTEERLPAGQERPQEQRQRQREERPQETDEERQAREQREQQQQREEQQRQEREQPRSLDPKEVFDLGPVQYDRATLIEKLQERDAHVQAVNEYLEIFRMWPEQARQLWKPLIDEMSNDPKMAAYLEDCVAYYRQKKGKKQPTNDGTQAENGDPEARRQIAAMQQQQQREALERANERVSTEITALKEKFPILKDDENLLRILAAHTQKKREAGDMTYTITRAADELSEYITAWASYKTQQKQAVDDAEKTARQQRREKVPALNGSQGASPNGSRRRADRYTGSLEDAVDDFMEHSAELGFE